MPSPLKFYGWVSRLSTTRVYRRQHTHDIFCASVDKREPNLDVSNGIKYTTGGRRRSGVEDEPTQETLTGLVEKFQICGSPYDKISSAHRSRS